MGMRFRAAIIHAEVFGKQTPHRGPVEISELTGGATYMKKISKLLNGKRVLFIALLVFSVIILTVPLSVRAQSAQPVVAIHVSELNQSLDSQGEWPWPSWHYFVMHESLEEALRSDGTPFVEVSDADIEAGSLLNPDGSPKYPILFSLASEATDTTEITPLINYVTAGGMLFVGSSAFTRYPDGTTRPDFALASAMGLHMVNSDSFLNWYENEHFTTIVDNQLVAGIPTGTLDWRMPLSSEEIPLGVSPTHIPHWDHWVFQVSADSGTTVIVNGDSGPLLATTQYGKGNFVYHGAAQPLIGHGGYDSSMYAYLIYRHAIEWAFQLANLPIVKLSPWRYNYDSAFVARHDFENNQASILAISSSASFENSQGAKGDYYFCTGAVRSDMSTSNRAAAIAGLQAAVTTYGATIGSHNGGLPNPVDLSLTSADEDYWHWGPDEALDVTSFPTYTFTTGQEYAQASIEMSFQDIQGWLSGLDNGRVGCGGSGTCPRIWSSPYFNATREASYEIMAGQGGEGAITLSDQSIGLLPHWTLSTQTAGEYYPYLALSYSDWYVGSDVAQSLENHTTESMQAAVDFYYNIGGFINIYGTNPSGSSTIEGQYITYCTDSTAKPGMWATNAVGIYDWWNVRSSVTVTPSYSITGSTADAHAIISGATDTGTAIEMEISNISNPILSDFSVYLNSVLVGPSNYRIFGNAIKILVGNTTSTVDVKYAVPNPLPTTTSLSPAVIAVGGTAFTLTVNGTGFVNSSVVQWNGANRTTTYVSPTQLTAAITATDIATAGTATVTVFNPAPGGGTSNPQTFTMENLPTLAISPPSATETTTGPVSYTVTYTYADTVTLAGGNVTLNATGTATGAVAVSGTGTTTRTVTISSITGDGTLGITIAAGTASNAAGTALASGPSTTFTVHNTAPTLVISAPTITDTNTGPVSYTVTYTGADTVSLPTGSVTLNVTGTATGTVGVSGTGTTTRTVTISGITGNGTLGITIAAGTANNLVGPAAGAGPSTPFTVDNTAPTLVISAPSTTDTNTGPVSYTVTYTGADTVSLPTGSVTLNVTGTATGTVGVSGTGTTTRTVTITGITGNGTLGISIAAGTASDAAGNTALASGPSATFTVDNIAPTLVISAPTITDTNTGPVTYTVTYTGADTVSLPTGSVTLNPTGTATGTVAVSGTGNTTRTVTISSIGGNGTLGISIAAGTASDLAGNTALASGPSTTFTVDNTAPTLVISAPTKTDTNTGPVSYTVTYTGADTVSLPTGSVTLNATGTATGTVAVSGTGNTTRTVTISGIAGDGTLGISIAAGTASDLVGNTALASGPSITFTVDNTAPTVVTTSTTSNPTNASPIPVTVTFSEPVTGFTSGEVVVGNGSVSSFTAVSGSVYTLSVTPAANGLVTVDIPANSAQDAAGNGNTAAAELSRTFNSTHPTVTITSTTGSPTNVSPIPVTVTFSEPVTGFTSGEVVVGNGTISLFTAVSGTVYTFSVTPAANGVVTVDIPANAAYDSADNGNLPAVEFSRTFDNIAPTLVISAPSTTDTNTGPVTYTVTYTGADTVTLVTANVTLNPTGTASGTVAVSGTGNTTRTVTISGITGNGTLGISIPAGTASDLAGNTAAPAGPSTPFTVDNIAPTLVISSPSITDTNTGPVTYTVTYTGADTVTLAAGNVILNPTGTATGTVAVSGTGTGTRTVTISNITGNGTLGISIAAATASDAAGNTAASAGPSTTFTVDNTAPSVTISAPSLTVANSSVSVTYTVTYTGADTVTLAAGNVTLNKTGAASGIVGVSGTGNTRTVTISSISGLNGTLGISIAAGTASDLAGNTVAAAGPSATFSVDNGSGDLNGNGVVDVTDALKALRIAAGLDSPTPTDIAILDVAPIVNGQRQPDGKVDMEDVVALLRNVAGLLSW